MQPIIAIVGIILAVLAGAFVLAALVFLFGTIFSLTLRVFKAIFTFIGATFTDILRVIGSVFAAALFAPLTVLAIVVGRWSRAKHLANAFSMECHSAFRSLYRIFIGNPARLFGLSSALEGVERRVPEAMAAAPTSDKPSSKRVGVFDGYTIIGSLKSGGSGGKLYIAEPDEIKQAAFVKRGLDVGQVVIKVFSLHDGSSMPQIVRESRALDAARKLGLVLEHELTSERFFYVMRYVPGESLSAVTHRMHSLSPREGLSDTQLKYTIGYTDDLLTILDSYHRAGLWHKDVKPDNIIIDGKHGGAKAHLVDFGLVTPLRSAMTLTTHGTEYFRDPELVRQALRGVKVHQIDGSKFDVYAAGAVLYSMIENSFPAHSGLSQITKRCPDALRWIVRRAMAEYDRRYPSAAAMLADLRVVMTASDPFKVKPADLPSVKLGDQVAEEMPIPEPMPAYGGIPTPRAGSPIPPTPKSDDQRGSGRRVSRPKVNLVGWWSGKYAVAGGANDSPIRARKRAPVSVETPRHRVTPVDQRQSAKEQVRSARHRAQQMRQRASKRRSGITHRKGDYKNTPSAGIIFAGIMGVGILFVGIAMVGGLLMAGNSQHITVSSGSASTPVPPAPMDAPAVAWDLGSLPRVDAHVLLVSNLSGAIDPTVDAQIKAGLLALNTQGLHTIGNIDEHSTEDDINHLADYRKTIGATPSDSDQLVFRSRDWITEHPDFDGVMVLATDPESAEHRVIFIADNFHSTLPLDEDAVGRLLTVLHSNGYAALPD